MVRAHLALALAGLCAALGGCDRPAAAESLSEWSPSDHHSVDDDQAPAQGRGPAGGKGQVPEGDSTQLIDLAWRQQCQQCHGVVGHGDGPMGAMLRAHDLTDPVWQAQVTDADIAATIRNGRNKMPKFDTLPDAVVTGLVARIRGWRTPGAPAPAAATSGAAPGGSAAPPASARGRAPR